MFYYKVECGNGYCGCDEEWLMVYEKEPDEDTVYHDAYECYSYEDGFAGSEKEYDTVEEEEEWWENYEQAIWENLSVEQIDEEEYMAYEEEGWEIR